MGWRTYEKTAFTIPPCTWVRSKYSETARKFKVSIDTGSCWIANVSPTYSVTLWKEEYVECEAPTPDELDKEGAAWN